MDWVTGMSHSLTCSYLKEISEMGHSANFDIIDVFGAVLLEDGEQVCAGVLGAQYPGQLVEGVGQHTTNLPLCVCVCGYVCMECVRVWEWSVPGESVCGSVGVCGNGRVVTITTQLHQSKYN